MADEAQSAVEGEVIDAHDNVRRHRDSRDGSHHANRDDVTSNCANRPRDLVKGAELFGSHFFAQLDKRRRPTAY